MSDTINVCFMSDEALATAKSNIKQVAKYMRNNRYESSWMRHICDSKVYIEKKYKIKDFTLKVSPNGNYDEVDYENSIILFEALKDLPRYILTDERFWAWINFEKCYEAAIQSIPIKDKESTVLNHYFFSAGVRRGIFFGVMSRSFFRVELSYDDKLEDHYELTKFVIENPQRFRELSWRTFSSQKHIVLGVLKAEKMALEHFEDDFKSRYFPQIAKYISLLGSVRLLDSISEDEIAEKIYGYVNNLIEEEKINETA